MELERHMVITTDFRYGIEWYVTDEINGIGIQRGTDEKEPMKIPAGEYFPVSISVGEYDTLVCGPSGPRDSIIIK